MSGHLQHNQEKLLKSLLIGKLPRNISWNEVIDLMGKLGEIQSREDNGVEFVIGSHRASFKHPHSHSLEVPEVSRLRRFLHGAEIDSGCKGHGLDGRMVVVVDHRQARIYEYLGGGGPQSKNSVRPYDPYGFHRHLIHRKEAHYEGQRVPEEPSFYEEIVQVLEPATQIVLIGHGTGKSSALDALMEHIKTHHSTMLPRIVTSEITDLSAVTEKQIETMAQEIFTTRFALDSP